MVSLNAVIWKEEGLSIAKCQEIGTVSQGKTADEALKNLKEATKLYLEKCPLKEKS